MRFSRLLLRTLRDAPSDAEAIEAAATGFAVVPMSAVGDAGEDELNAAGVSIRCLQTADGGLPRSGDDAGVVAIVGRAY